MNVLITSFGYLHGEAPEAHVTLDLRHHFRDPHVSPELRYMTADDRPVREAVLRTPGILPLIDATAAAVRAYQAGPSTGPVTVAVGCAGGRHRAATVARTLASVLRDESEGLRVVVADRDLSRPVVQR
ncbi:ATPase [Streptomyces ovatisporus]|uniref:ATPase n=1 Tax=Streptomyces ovatisporus TaxID=1128682 RepID=A0ABV9AF20_9ACTN